MQVIVYINGRERAQVSCLAGAWGTSDELVSEQKKREYRIANFTGMCPSSPEASRGKRGQAEGKQAGRREEKSAPQKRGNPREGLGEAEKC